MSQMYWKEWREQRMIVAAAPLMLLALLIGYGVVVRSGLLGPGEKMEGGVASGLLLLTWMVSAALCGSSVMSPETDAGTLRFLSMLPISRGQLWRGKVTAALATSVACLAASTAVYLVFCSLAGQGASLQLGEMRTGAGASLTVALLVFAAGCYITMLLTPTISALLATIVISIAGAIPAVLLSNWIDDSLSPSSFEAAYVLFCLLATLFLWLSYRTFAHGETLRTAKRFRLLIMWRPWVLPLLINIALVGGALLGAYYWIVD